MIRLEPRLARNIADPQGLGSALQQAIELEHSTIPPYLYALYSLEPGTNDEIAALVRSVVIEEMTHMALVCNILNALGGEPLIADPAFVPTYPGHLPGAVESSLVVGLEPFSADLLERVFMKIEEPEDALEFSDRDADEPHITIGEFYARIRTQLHGAAFTGEPSRQVTHALLPELTAISDAVTATAAIDVIVEQGEGTTTSPLEGAGGQPAHYYRFAEIVHGKRLVPNPDAGPDAAPNERYVYGGAPIVFDAAGVRPLLANPTPAAYPYGSRARLLSDNFDYTYTAALRSLHSTFNGRPTDLGAAIGLMESCKQQALDLGTVTLDGGARAGPRFAWQPTNP